MRLIVIGTEYAGKTTLIDALMEWGDSIGIHHHLDDHFSIPDRQFLSPDDQRAMLGMPPVIKERFQRFQIYYHIHVLQNHADCLLGGFHIEEAIYGPRYYYPKNPWPPYARTIEAELPADTILLLLKASPEAIRRRMREAPHPDQVVPAEDVEAVSAEFEKEWRQSWLKEKLQIDTTELTPAGLLEEFQRRIGPFLDTRDLVRRQLLGQA
jgi:hypothetical protein